MKEITIRCEAAETKLQSVQVRFEEEKAKLEKETAERRERMKKSLAQKAEAGRLNFLTVLLPVLDNLNLAISAAEENHSFENLIGGVKGTARSFERALINVGVETIDSVGQKFDPQIHEAVEMKEIDDEEKNGIVTYEFTEGYTFKGRLLRAARSSSRKFRQQTKYRRIILWKKKFQFYAIYQKTNYNKEAKTFYRKSLIR